MTSITPVMGRPYTTSRGSLRAPADWDASHGNVWCSAESGASQDLELPNALSREDVESAAQEWVRRGQEEHASIASFSVATQLQGAGSDPVGRTSVGVGPFPSGDIV